MNPCRFWVGAAIATLLVHSAAHGQMIVSDPPLTTVANMQLTRLIQLNTQLAEANRELGLLVTYIGNPRVAVARIDDLSSFVTNVGRMGAPGYRADDASKKVVVRDAMGKSENLFRRKVGTEVTVYGRRERRDPALYEQELRFEGMVLAGRELLEVNRKHQHTILGRLSTANDHLESARDQSQLLAAQGEIARLQALLAGANALAANLTSDIALAERERQIALEDRRRRSRETDRFLGLRQREASAEQARVLSERRASALAKGSVKRTDWDRSIPWVSEAKR